MTKQEIRQEWVKRLRSGNIKQTQGGLENMDGAQCCLGVLCNLAVENDIVSRGVPAFNDEWFSFDGNSGLLPESVMKWAGVSRRSGNFVASSTSESLASRNDGGYSFSEIADIIEFEPEGLFVKETV